MKQFRTIGVVASALFLAFLVAALSAPTPHALSQGVGTPITGWAWSDNIGWVKLNCTTAPNDCVGIGYGLASNGGTVNGYAWSDNIGWIRPAQSGDGCLGTGATLSGSNFSGWLKVLSVGGGWDGCISLSGSGYQASTASNPSYNNATDYAWGSDVVGWLAFNAASSCTPNLICNAGGTQLVDQNSCGGAPTSCTYGCVPGATSCNIGPTILGCISINADSCAAAPNVHRLDQTLTVQKGSSPSVYWHSQGATSCTLTGSPGGSGTSGSVVESNVQGRITLTLTCDGSQADQAVINIQKTEIEI